MHLSIGFLQISQILVSLFIEEALQKFFSLTQPLFPKQAAELKLLSFTTKE
jgi:hypothetical protein